MQTETAEQAPSLARLFLSFLKLGATAFGGPAMVDIRSWYQGPVAIATDLLVLNVSKDVIRQRHARVSDFAWYPPPKLYPPAQLAPPKYPSPLAQLNDELLNNVIPADTYENP